jgi:hypothetical protein
MIDRRWLLVWFVGCTRARPEPATTSVATPLEQARARPIPARIQGRFSFTIEAPALGPMSTGGVVILDRPGRGHLAVLGPLGGPLATLQTDGHGAALAIARDRRHYVMADADDAVREVTSGLVGLDDLLGLFVGDLPLDGAPVRSQRPLPEPSGYEVVLDAPEGAMVTLYLDPVGATPRSLVVVDGAGQAVLDVRYAPFAPFGDAGALLPTDITIELPRLGVGLEVRMKTWTVPDPVPEVFGLAAPEGFTSSPLEDTVRTWSQLLVPGETGRMQPSEEGG